MQLSEQPEYRIAIPAAMEGDYTTARVNLTTLIQRAQAQRAFNQVAYLTHVLADVEGRAGNSDGFHSLHSAAIAMFPDVPLEYIHYATGLLRHLGDDGEAIAQLVKAEQLLGTEQWKATGDDLPEQWYREEIARLRGEAAKKSHG